MQNYFVVVTIIIRKYQQIQWAQYEQETVIVSCNISSCSFLLFLTLYFFSVLIYMGHRDPNGNVVRYTSQETMIWHILQRIIATVCFYDSLLAPHIISFKSVGWVISAVITDSFGFAISRQRLSL
jgi:hypothetical protein